MPYITRDRRAAIVQQHEVPRDAGELNYAITELVLAFLGERPRYADFNAAVGALECCKLELYARMIRPYEDQKIQDNGDVYPVRTRSTS